MDSRIKEEMPRELSLESAGDNPASISLIEKYDLFVKGNLSDDSDEETEEFQRSRLKDQMKDYSNCAKTDDNDLFACFVPKPSDINIDEPIRQLESIRKTGEDGNSIFCTSLELDTIQERYGEILDYIADKTKLFSEVSSGIESGAVATKQKDDNMPETLIEKIKSVQQARDKLYDVESQVREQIEQLELVERYKMED